MKVERTIRYSDYSRQWVVTVNGRIAGSFQDARDAARFLLILQLEDFYTTNQLHNQLTGKLN